MDHSLWGFFSPCQTWSHKSAAGCYRGEMLEIFFMRSPVTECSWCVWSPGSLTSQEWPYQNIRETTFTWSLEKDYLLGKRLLVLKTQYQTQYYFLLNSLKISLLTDSMIKYILKKLFLSILSGITISEIHSLSFSELAWRSILSQSCISVWTGSSEAAFLGEKWVFLCAGGKRRFSWSAAVGTVLPRTQISTAKEGSSLVRSWKLNLTPVSPVPHSLLQLDTAVRWITWCFLHLTHSRQKKINRRVEEAIFQRSSRVWESVQVHKPWNLPFDIIKERWGLFFPIRLSFSNLQVFNYVYLCYK